MWSVAAWRAQNTFPPTPLSSSWSNRRCSARSRALPRPLPAGRPPLSGVHRPLLWLAHSLYLWPHSHIGRGHRPAEGMDVGKRHSGRADNERQSPVYLAGIQKNLCQLGNPSHDQQPSPSRGQRSRRGSSQGHQSPSRKDDSEWERYCRRLPHRPPAGTSRTLMGSAHPSCFLGAIFGRKCCHTPARSSRSDVSGGTLWTEQPQRSQLKPRRNTTCAPSPCRFSNQAPSSRWNTGVQSVGTRSQKWWSASLAGTAMVSRQRAVACSSATAASCTSSFPQPPRHKTGPGSFALYYYFFLPDPLSLP